MVPFFSTKTARRDQLAVRALICLFALLFLISAALSVLPSRSEVIGLLSENGLSGYSTDSAERPDRHGSALTRFSDRPITDAALSPESEPPSAQTGKPLPTPSVGADTVAFRIRQPRR